MPTRRRMIDRARARRVGARERLAHRLIVERAEVEARRRGVSRREFLRSSAGTATVLAMFEWLNACSGKPMRDATPPPPDMDDVAASRAAAGASATTSERTPAQPSSGSDAGPTGGPSGSDAVWGQTDAGTGPSCTVGSPDFVLDMQTRLIVRPENPSSFDIELWLPTYEANHPWIERPAGCVGYDCVDQAAYAEQVLAGSDTSVGALAGSPYRIGDAGEGGGYGAITNERVRSAADALLERFPRRVLTQASIMPNDRIDLQLAVMERIAPQFDHWRIEPGWSPEGPGGFWLTDEAARRVLQAGIDLGAPIFCINKGMPQSGFDPTYGDPRDIAEAALAFPQAQLVVLHAAFEHGFGAAQSSRPDADDPDADHGWGPGVGRYPEGPYAENDAAVQAMYPLDRGVNALIHGLRRAGIGPNGSALSGSAAPHTHVYVDCSAAWAELMVGRLDEAMHYFGKLLTHVGEDRILWGTDSPLYGNPQVLIEAFRGLEISERFQQEYGYPALTPERKQKILGLNAARLQATRDAARLPAGVECTLARAARTAPGTPATRRQLLRLARRA